MEEETRCINCGFNIEKDYILYVNGTEFTFDSFECAINFVAPRCSSCNTVIIGRGVHAGDSVFCSTTCSMADHSPIVP